MPKKKAVKKKEPLTRVQKIDQVAKTMLANEQKAEKERKKKAWTTYVEHKIIKGHNRKQAEAMANEIIYNQKPV